MFVVTATDYPARPASQRRPGRAAPGYGKTLAGKIRWLPRKEELSPAVDTDLNAGVYNHPVLILSHEPREDGTVRALTVCHHHEHGLELADASIDDFSWRKKHNRVDGISLDSASPLPPHRPNPSSPRLGPPTTLVWRLPQTQCRSTVVREYPTRTLHHPSGRTVLSPGNQLKREILQHCHDCHGIHGGERRGQGENTEGAQAQERGAQGREGEYESDDGEARGGRGQGAQRSCLDMGKSPFGSVFLGSFGPIPLFSLYSRLNKHGKLARRGGRQRNQVSN